MGHEIVTTFNEIETLINKDKYHNDFIEDLKKNFLVEIEKTKEALINFIYQNDLKFLETGISDQWNFLNEK